jgi:hypothetical protein
MTIADIQFIHGMKSFHFICRYIEYCAAQFGIRWRWSNRLMPEAQLIDSYDRPTLYFSLKFVLGHRVYFRLVDLMNHLHLI